MRGSGLFFCLFCGVTWWVGGGVPVTKGGACLFGRLPALPLALFLPPISPTPFPGGEGGNYKFISPGASPPAPLRLNPSGACSPCRCGTRRRACPRRCRLGGRWRYPAGACLSPRLPTPPLVYFPAPYPPDPLPRWGRGRLLLYFAGGFAPGTPAAEPARRLLTLPRGRGPSQTPPSLATDSSISPGPPSPWLPALPPVNKQNPLVVQVPRPAQPWGCKGRSPLHEIT